MKTLLPVAIVALTVLLGVLAVVNSDDGAPHEAVFATHDGNARSAGAAQAVVAALPVVAGEPAPAPLHVVAGARAPTPPAVEPLEVADEPVPMTELRGIVRDEAGLPLERVYIDVSAGEGDAEPAITCATGADGRFKLPPFPARRGRLSMSKAGYVPRYGAIPSPPAPGTHPSMRITLSRAVTLRGELLWMDGEPCAQADIEVRPAIEDAFAYHGVVYGPGVPTLGSAVTDADGRFAIDGLAMRQVVQLQASVGGYRPRYPFTVELLAEPEQSVALELARPATLHVVLDDLAARADITRKAKEEIHYVLFARDSYDLVGQAFGDEKPPRFTGLDPMGTYELNVYVGDLGSKEFPDRIVLREGDNTWHGTLGEPTPAPAWRHDEPPPRWTFHWTFVDEQHVPISGAEANARWTSERWISTPLLHGRALDTGEEVAIGIDWSSGDDIRNEGTCQVSIPSPIELSFGVGGARQVVSPVVPDQQVELVLPVPTDAARVRFIAQDPGGRRMRMPDCTVRQVGQEASIRMPAGVGGTDAHVWLPLGDYTAVTYGGEYARTSRELSITDTAPRTVRLVMQRGGTLRGTIRLPHALKPDSVQLFSRRATLDGLAADTTPRLDGSFEFVGMTPGDWILTLRALDAGAGSTISVSLPATIVADRITEAHFDAGSLGQATADVVLRLDSAAEAGLTLASADGSFALSLELRRGEDRLVHLPHGTIHYRLLPRGPIVGKGLGEPRASGATVSSTGVLEATGGLAAVTLEL